MKYFYTDGTDNPELSLYNDRSETKLYRFYEPEPGLFIAETPMVIRRALDAGYEPVSMLGEEGIVKKQEEEGLFEGLPDDLPVYVSDDETLSRIAGYRLARGLMCLMRRKKLPEAEQIAAGSRRLVVLDRIMNPTNVGAIFRSAAALGMDSVLLTKGSADPLYRRAARVSMGNVFLIPWTFADERLRSAEIIAKLREQGFLTAAMALTDDAIPLGERDFSCEEKLAVVMGSESDGLAPETIKACGLTVRIPMSNGVDSLNVAAASAVAFWEMRKRQGLPRTYSMYITR